MSISGETAFTAVGMLATGCRLAMSMSSFGEFVSDSLSASEVEPSTTLPRLNFPRLSLDERASRSKSEMDEPLADLGVRRGANRGES